MKIALTLGFDGPAVPIVAPTSCAILLVSFMEASP